MYSTIVNKCILFMTVITIKVFIAITIGAFYYMIYYFKKHQILNSLVLLIYIILVIVCCILLRIYFYRINRIKPNVIIIYKEDTINYSEEETIV